jgi:hypothetical protein
MGNKATEIQGSYFRLFLVERQVAAVDTRQPLDQALWKPVW